jgi:TIR domain
MNQSMVLSMFLTGGKIYSDELNRLFKTKLKKTSAIRIEEGVMLSHYGLCLDLEVEGNINDSIDKLISQYDIDTGNIFSYCTNRSIEISFNIHLGAPKQYYDLQIDCLVTTGTLSRLGVQKIYIYSQDLFPIEILVKKSSSSIIFKDIVACISAEHKRYRIARNKNRNRRKENFFTNITDQSSENRDKYRTFILHRDKRIAKRLSDKYSLVALEEATEIMKHRIGFRKKDLSPAISIMLMILTPFIVWMFYKDPYPIIGVAFLGILSISKFIDIVIAFFLYHPENDLRILELSVEIKKEDSKAKINGFNSYLSSFRFDEAESKPQLPQVLISYLDIERSIGQMLMARLQNQCPNIHLSFQEIQLDSNFIQPLLRRLTANDYFLPLFSPDSLKLHWLQQELAIVLPTLTDRGITLLPIISEPIVVSPLFARYQWLDLSGNQLVNALNAIGSINFRQLSTATFADLAIELLLTIGFHPSPNGQDSYQLLEFRDPATLTNRLFLADFRLYHVSHINLNSIQQLVKIAQQNAQGALIVTDGQLTSVARDWVQMIQDSTGFRIHLLAGTDLKHLLLLNPELVSKYFMPSLSQVA